MDYSAKNKQLEREKINLSERLELSSRDGVSEKGNLSKQLEKLQDAHQRLSEENEFVKDERDKKLREFHQRIEKDRDTYSTKKRETDLKVQKTETKHTELLLGHERERAKWSQEKSDLVHLREDLKSEVDRIKIRSDVYYKENVNLKNEVKQLRNSRGSMAGPMAGALQSRMGIAGARTGFTPGAYAPRTQQTDLGADGGTTDRSMGRYGPSSFGGAGAGGVAASMQAPQTGFKMGGAGGMASSSMNNAPGSKPTGLKLDLQGLNQATGNLDISQSKNLLSTPSSSNELDEQPQSRFSLPD